MNGDEGRITVFATLLFLSGRTAAYQGLSISLSLCVGVIHALASTVLD